MLLALWSWRTGEWADPSGGFADVFPNVNQENRRKRRKAIYDELTRSGFTKQDIPAKALKVVERATSSLPVQAKPPDTETLVMLLMAELRLTVKVPDYTRAIQAALVAKKLKDAKRLQDEEDEEALLLFM